KNGRHTVVDGSHDSVWLRGDNGTAAYFLAFRTTPEVPEAGKGEGTATFQRDIHGSFAAMLFLPLVETIGNHETAFRAQQPLEARLLCQCLCPGVDHLGANRLVFGPRGDQAPLQPVQVSRAVAQNADHL